MNTLSQDVGLPAAAPAVRHVRRVRVLGTGVAVRNAMVTSAEMDVRLGLPPGTVEPHRSCLTPHGNDEKRG